MSYGAEAWTVTKKDEQALLVFERKVFRRIYCPKYGNGEWKNRTNRELEGMSKGENTVKWIKGQTYNKINGAIRRHFGKQINKETKLRIHNITAKAALKFGFLILFLFLFFFFKMSQYSSIYFVICLQFVF